jgi:hypothetical protein
MRYLLQKYSDDEYVIINDVSDYQAGFVRPLTSGSGPYRVQNDEPEDIAIINSIDEAIPALAAHYEQNPPKWMRESDGICWSEETPKRTLRGALAKDTQFGWLRVDQIKPGQWLAYRDDHELLADGKAATFSTCEKAQRVADAHLYDGYPDSETIADGYSWLPDPDVDWRKSPYRVAARARFAA